MNLEKIFSEKVKEIFEKLYKVEIERKEIRLQPTIKDYQGDITLVVFSLAKSAKTSPKEVGEAIGKLLKEETSLVTGYNVVKGFLNLVVSDALWLDLFNHFYLTEKPGFSTAKGEQVMVEYSSPNTNKPLHLGHLRNIFLGFSVSRILEANGHDVVKAQIINDRGIHICKSMLAWKEFGNEETPETAGLKGDKLVGNYYVEFEKRYREQVKELINQGKTQEEAEKEAPLMVKAQKMLKKWEEKDSEVYQLWQKMNHWVYQGFNQTYNMMGVDFDKLYYESDTYVSGKKEVLKGLEQGIFYRKEDGSVWVDLEEEGLDHKILLRSDGTSVYMTQDIGTAILRFNEFPSLKRLIYTVGNEQEYHFKVLFSILKKLGFQWAEGLHHLSYGMVDLPAGKMKSREGTVVDADDLITEMVETAQKHTIELGKIEGFSDEKAKELYKMIGLGALKFYLLKVDPRKRVLFNPQESIEFHGFTGPFVQYTYARISALLRRANDTAVSYQNEKTPGDIELNPYEREVIHLLSDFRTKVKEAAFELSPSIIAQYVFDLAKEYNTFYAEIPIFKEKSDSLIKFRLAFSAAVARTINQGMWLLGIDVPERM